MTEDPIGKFLDNLYSDGARFSGGTVSVPKVLKAVKSRSFEDDLNTAIEVEVQQQVADNIKHWNTYVLPGILRKAQVDIINQLQKDGEITLTALAVYNPNDMVDYNSAMAVQG